jgi:beta-glucanase (GH16 family)
MVPCIKKRGGSMKARSLYGIMSIIFFCSGISAAGGWKLFWADEFDSTALNEQNWTVRTANPGWVNNEQQRYTGGHDQATSNITVKNGCLNLFALKNASTGEITSGRIEGGGKKSFQYGRMEARMRMPISKGYWPAFWMLGTTGGWPSCGEIDIMEGKGRMPTWTSGAFHSSQGTPVVSGNYTMPAGTGNVHDSFHIFAVEWSADSIRWYFEKQNFLTLTKAAHAGIPLSNNFYFLLNVAVGGNFDGNSDNTTVFPESLVVDYVHVYKWDPAAQEVTGLPQRAPAHAFVARAGSCYTVTLPFAQHYRADLVSVIGKTAFTRSGTGKSFAIPVSGLSQGAYVLTVRGAFGSLSDRIITERR